jgi:aminoglycoside phosphotransferase (APT) family kinase protein
MASTVRRLVTREFPGHTIKTIDSQDDRPGNETVRVEFTNREPVYAKVDRNAAGRVRREAAAARCANKHASVNVPEVITADPDAEVPYLITSPLAGKLMNDRWTAGDNKEVLMRAVGETLAAVHDAQIDDIGTINGWDGSQLQIKSMNWTEALCATVHIRVENEFSDRFSEIPEDLITTIQAINPELERDSAALLHGDLNRINIHLEPNGLLDWERALVGDPAFDLTETIFHHLDQPDVDDAEKPNLREALFDGYRNQRGSLPAQFETYQPLYWAIAYLLMVQTFDRWAPQVDVPTDDLEANIREEAYSRMSAAEDALLSGLILALNVKSLRLILLATAPTNLFRYLYLSF